MAPKPSWPSILSLFIYGCGYYYVLCKIIWGKTFCLLEWKISQPLSIEIFGKTGGTIVHVQYSIWD